MFEYDEDGRAVDYICSHHYECTSACELVRAHMIQWNNGLPAQMRGRRAKVDKMLGSNVSIPSITG
jgi:hypothetical protein